jgi:hypothetical protein
MSSSTHPILEQHHRNSLYANDKNECLHPEGGSEPRTGSPLHRRSPGLGRSAIEPEFASTQMWLGLGQLEFVHRNPVLMWQVGSPPLVAPPGLPGRGLAFPETDASARVPDVAVDIRLRQ